MLPGMPDAPILIADRGYDADRFRRELSERGTRPCIPGCSGRCRPICHGKKLYRSRYKIEIMFGRLKGWRRITTDAPIPSCPPSHSPPRRSSGCRDSES